MKKRLERLYLLATTVVIFAACTEPPAPTLVYKDREVVDSLYRHKVDSLKPIFDSLCTSHFDSAVQFKTDSMLKVREALEHGECIGILADRAISGEKMISLESGPRSLDIIYHLID